MPNPLMMKLGPLPAWGWLGIGGVGLLTMGAMGKSSQGQGQGQGNGPSNDTTDPNSMGQNAGGVYGHGFNPSGGGGNGWTGNAHGHYQHGPVSHEIRPPRGHSGNWGGADRKSVV